MKLPDYYTPVKDNGNLARDERSKAIINVNVAAWEAHMKRKERDQRLDSTVEAVADLKGKMDRIEGLLEKLLDKLP